jgi:hypothetical protein
VEHLVRIDAGAIADRPDFLVGIENRAHVILRCAG